MREVCVLGLVCVDHTHTCMHTHTQYTHTYTHTHSTHTHTHTHTVHTHIHTHIEHIHTYQHIYEHTHSLFCLENIVQSNKCDVLGIS